MARPLARPATFVPVPTPTYPPPAAVLLRRTTSASLQGPDWYRVRENWYNPDPNVRSAALYFPPDSTDNSAYSRPLADIIDRWCLEPGAAPFTEVQVHHNGAGGITLTNVDGVSACERNCTLTLTLRASAITDGRGLLTATAGGVQGPILFTINDFQTPGVGPTFGSAHVFDYLRPGTYTVTVRETRPGGCTATATLALTATYGPRFEVAFKDIDSVPGLLQVFERGYTGAVETLTAQADPLVLDWPGGATDHVFSALLRGSQCQLGLYLSYDEQLLGLFSGDERLHRVEYRRAGLLAWAGYLLPEQYDVAFLAPPAVFNLSATDGLGTLSDLPFLGSAGESLRGDWTLLAIVQLCLGKLDLDLPLHVLLNLFPSTATLGTPAIEQIAFDVAAFADEKGKAWDCGKVLRELLETFQARLYQQDGAWWLERLSELSIEALPYAAYGPTGLRLSDTTRTLLLAVLPPTEGRPHWLEGNQRQQLRPAVARVTLAADPGEPVNLLAFALPKYSDLPLPVPASWSAFSSQTAPYAALINQGQDKAPVLRLIGGANSINFRATPATAPWVQPPTIRPVPFGTTSGSIANNGVQLSFTAKPYGNTPATDYRQQSRMGVAVRLGDTWVLPSGGESATPVFTDIYFPDATAVVFLSTFGRRALPVTRLPVTVRLSAPVNGASPCTVDITNIKLQWLNGNPGTGFPDPLADPTILLDAYTTSYTADTGQLVSRVDEALTLRLSDTTQVRHAGTPLDQLGRPVQGWQEPAAPGQLRELGDYAVRDRVLHQRIPAQALTGTLRGNLPAGPGQLLFDAGELRPAVYLLTSATHRPAEADWAITAVQLCALQVPPYALPEGAIYNEDDALDPTVWQDEAGNILVYELS